VTCDDTMLSLGVYLLGALDADERALVEAHLDECATCRAELDELAALPSLLEQLSLADFDAEKPVASEDLFHRVATRVRAEHAGHEVADRRRYRRLVAVAAVVVIAGSTVGGLVIARQGGHSGSGGPVVSAADVSRTGSHGSVRMRVELAAQTSGTSLQVDVAGLPEDEHCRLIAVARNGERDVAGRWNATYQGDAQQTGSTMIPLSQLSQLVLLGTGGRTLVTVAV
jgi:predicted anti-sigma-YlaC factor YlaD